MEDLYVNPKFSDVRLVKLVLRQGNVAGAQSFIHKKMSKIYGYIDGVLIISNLMVSVLSLVLIVLTIIPDLNNTPMKIIAGLVGSLTLLIEGLKKYFRTTDMIADHLAASAEYSKLRKNIERNVQIRGSTGESLMFEACDCADDYQEIFNTSPNSWNFVKKRYVAKYGVETGVKKYDLDDIHSVSSYPKNMTKSPNISEITKSYMNQRIKTSESSDEV